MIKEKIDLDKNELLKIDRMITTYKRKYDEITNLEKTLKTLVDTREKLKEDLDKVRKEENDFGEYLTKKYGKGRFNIETFQYELEQK